MANFVTLTRVFKYKGSSKLNFQTITVNAATVSSIRASNRLGHPDHRSTIVADGVIYDLADTSKAVKSKLGIRA